MTEPAQLSRGKRFQKIVQTDFIGNTKDGTAHAEARLDLSVLTNVRRAFGRADIFIAEDGDDYVTILEIKATDWDITTTLATRCNSASAMRLMWSFRSVRMTGDRLVRELRT